MRTIWAIYRADLRRAHRSLIASVVVFGLVVIPSLFTWFNVAASWDPFGNTKSLRIAIANTDAGYKSDLVPLHVNIGDSVVSALRKIVPMLMLAIPSPETGSDATTKRRLTKAVLLLMPSILSLSATLSLL